MIDICPTLEENFLKVLHDHTAGDPMRADVKWTNLSRREIAKRLTAMGTPVSRNVVSSLLRKHGYRRRKAQKKKTMGPRNPNRNAQFENIARLKKEYLKAGLPVISMDTKKTAMGGTGRTGFQKQCTDGPYPAELAACSFVHMEAVGRQGPPLSTKGPRLAILKYQGSDHTQPYPTFVVRQSATLLYGFAPQRK